MDKLHISNEMREFDLKSRNFYDTLTDEERKKFSNYLMIRWGSSVEANLDVQKYYLLSLNERLNKDFFSIGRHPKLQWLLCTTVSPGIGTFKHTWIPAGKRSKESKVKKFFSELYPHLNDEELALLESINSIDTVKQLARDMGWDDKKIKENL